MYPTAAKMVAALAFAAIAWWVSDLVKPALPEGMPAGWLSPVNAAVGFLLGWRIMGRRAGQGYVTALGIGWSTAAAITIVCLLIWAGNEMLERSIDLYYDGPVQALEQGVQLMVDYASLMLAGPVIPALLVAAALAAVLTEWVSRRAR